MNTTKDSVVAFSVTELRPRMRLAALFQRLQTATKAHAEQAGFGFRDLAKCNRAWVLNRMALFFKQLPADEDTTSVRTWHRGCRGYRAYRDYEVFSGNDTVICGSSIWLMMNTCERKLVRIPPEVDRFYGIQARKATGFDIDGFRPDPGFTAGAAIQVPLRPTDFDHLGHVNNAAYPAFLETLVGSHSEIDSLMIGYHSEIGPGHTAVTVESADATDGVCFRIRDDRQLFAYGRLMFKERTDS